jgi:hypothetical protein
MNPAPRVTLARDAVAHHAFRTGSADDPLSTQIVGLLCTIRHLCEAERLSWRHLDAEARDAFLAHHQPEEV